MRKNLSLLLPAFGLALFVFIVWRTGPAEIAAVFMAVEPGRLGIAVALVGVVLVLRGLRWSLLLKVAGIDYPLLKATAVWTIGFAAASVTPAKSGDAIRAFYIQEETGRSLGEAFFTVFIERLFDLVFVLMLGLVSVLVFSRYYTEIPSAWLVIVASAVVVLCLYLAMNRKLMRLVLRPVFDLLVPARYKDMVALNITSFYDSMAVYARARGQLLLAGILTIILWALIFLLAWCVATGFGIDVSVGYIFLIMPVVTLVEILPVSVAGLGTRDATVIYFFSVVGISSAAAVGFSLGYLLIGTYASALIGFVMWLRHPLRTKRAGQV
jgi:uncharacterized protein (TIRG00374 family)